MPDAVTTLVDANVLIDVMSGDPANHAGSRRALAIAASEGPVAINPIVYAEVSTPFGSADAVDRALASMELARLDLPWSAAYRTSQAFLAYRRAGGSRRSPLPDFYIGAHAELAGLRLLTRDNARYATYFPTVELMAP
ncbi:tRNA(fMet)-specific endonuclease VapC [Paraconexibacter sp. AEG42_29]|uniref:Ribonuclease VapC n=1 Tax=Paraconexibacter sp. AEG42_29 TaxID=2997339 RepID=A0AAU7B231_9ACTN